MSHFLLVYLLMQSIILVMWIYAFRHGLLKKGQTTKSSSKPMGYLIQHGGVWGDIIYISALVGWFHYEFSRHWTNGATALSWMVSIAFSTFMIGRWRSFSKVANDAMSMDEKTTPVGWLHGLYMIVALTYVFLFYFGTPTEFTRKYVWGVSGLLALHIAIGTIQPGWILFKKVMPGSIRDTLIGWLLLLGATLWAVR